MISQLLADLVVLLHLAFILFAALGGLAALRWPRLVWLHLPMMAWAAWVELAGRICPLTPLENRLRLAAGNAGYEGDFIAHYLVPIIYPGGLTRPVQVALGAVLVLANGIIYAILWRRANLRRQSVAHSTSR